MLFDEFVCLRSDVGTFNGLDKSAREMFFIPFLFGCRVISILLLIEATPVLPVILLAVPSDSEIRQVKSSVRGKQRLFISELNFRFWPEAAIGVFDISTYRIAALRV